jgi:internalin A
VPKFTPQTKPKDFVQQCNQKKSLPVDTRHTIKVLLKEVGIKKCELAFSKLDSLTGIGLNRNKIVDVKPLATLTDLKILLLYGNQIVDVEPLTTLTNLKILNLSYNRIVDMKPLNALSNLETLFLDGNQIIDLKPLIALTNLVDLRLENNPLPLYKYRGA